MHRANPSLLVLTGLLSAAAGAGNLIDVQGSGHLKVNIDSRASESVIDLYQVGPFTPGAVNEAGTDLEPITQTGTRQTARIGQGASHGGGVWTEGAAVSNNRASIRQTGSADDQAGIYQSSDGNRATISQEAASQAASILQSVAGGNQAALVQSGAAMTALISQNGTTASVVNAIQAGAAPYTLTVSQGGDGGHSADIETTASYQGPGVTVNQTGSANTASIRGMSGGSAEISQSGTLNSVELVNQSAGAQQISQEGSRHGLSITHYNTGVSLSVVQTGEGNGGTTSYSPNPPPEGPDYRPAP